MAFTPLTRQAITHTRHCLTGCAIGEITGMAIGQSWSSNAAQIALAVSLAFAFGYTLTFTGALRGGMAVAAAFRLALAVDNISILSMEIIDNTLEWLIPGAINAQLHNAIFWWSEVISLSVAFLLTVPVNRYVMSRSKAHAH